MEIIEECDACEFSPRDQKRWLFFTAPDGKLKIRAAVQTVKKQMKKGNAFVIAGTVTAICVLLFVSLLIKQEVEIASLRNDFVQLEDLVNRMNNLEAVKANRDDVEILRNDTEQIQAQMMKDIESNDEEIEQMKSEEKKMQSDIENEKDKWPKGSYCIIKTQHDCPDDVFSQWDHTGIGNSFCCRND